VSVPLGIAKAVRAGTRFDTVTSLLVLVGYAIPGFVLGLAVLVVVGGQLRASTAVDSATSLAVNGIGQLFVLQKGGNVLESRGSSWVIVAKKILALHVSSE
jgi:ABC-type microcin C transport system permease subunit YejB